MSAEMTACLFPAYRIVAAAFVTPAGASRTAVLEGAETALAAARALGRGGPLARAIEGLAATMDAITEGESADEHARVFGHASADECPPYETRWSAVTAADPERTLAALTDLYRAHGPYAPEAFDEGPDHVSSEVGFAGHLAAREARAGLAGDLEGEAAARDARRRFHEEHLGLWGPLFARRLVRRAGWGPYLAAARALVTVLATDAVALGLAPLAGAAPRVAVRRAAAGPRGGTASRS